MAIAIAAIRRAANSLRESKEVVSVPALARILECPPAEVKLYVHRITGLADEIGLVRGKSGLRNGDYYLAVAALLRNQKIPVTINSLAGHMQLNPRLVRTYLDRYPDLRVQLGVVSEGIATVEKTRMKLDELAAKLKEGDEKISMNKVADYCDFERSAFHHLCKGHPSLREIIEPHLRRRVR